MKSGPIIALIVAALSWPAVAQRGSYQGRPFGSGRSGGRGASSMRAGSSVHSGFIGRRGASEPGGYAPAAPFRYGSLGPPPAVRFNPPRISTPHIGVGQNGIITTRPAYRGEFSGPNRAWIGNRDGAWDHRRDHDGDHDRDRDRFHARARLFENWFLFSNPGWVGYGYPYATPYDPGFYDGSDYGNPGYQENDQGSAYNNGSPDSQLESPYEGYGEPGAGNYAQPGGGNYGELDQQPQPWPEPETPTTIPQSHFSVSGQTAAAAPALEGPLTVIFKGGRGPEQMQNYMLTATALTDLDADHYEQIPLDQIDIAATARANRASGMEFQVPGASRD